jgi:hypothetical protein
MVMAKRSKMHPLLTVMSILLFVLISVSVGGVGWAKKKKPAVMFKAGESVLLVGTDQNGRAFRKNVVVADVQERRSTTTGKVEYWVVLEETVTYILPQDDPRIEIIKQK